MDILLTPFEVSFVARALVAGAFAAVLCACIGTWVVLRGLAFFGDAMSHGMLPGVAIASILGGNLMLGAALSALVMSIGVVWTSREAKLSQDVSIGLQFIGMLALGVVIVSHSESFAVDLTSFLFGDVLGVRRDDVLIIGIAALVTAIACWILHRPFVALAFDEQKATTLGMRPHWAHLAMLALTALATVASFQIVGTLLVFGLLIGPPATVTLVARTIPAIMAGAALLGVTQIYAGLLISWYAETAAGATIALLSASTFFVSLLVKRTVYRVRSSNSNENSSH
ncbi:metal ABC transporter permease [Kocuria coralli]|uniref:Metal ABC transporter permease n=1 Tax=Kocuria coralli TaxID=1461025 RepID=A0A5J5KUS5_9MICC|nr:zinc ABC transporter permease AztB [Kocuria coralli]KAA9393324.1 metal ABC transporter permease [Kocuria coralli]